MLVVFVQNVEIHICAICTKIINIVKHFCADCTRGKELCRLHKNHQHCSWILCNSSNLAKSGKAGNFFVQPAQKLLTMLVDFVQNVEIHICAMCTKIINIVNRFCAGCTKGKELCNLHKSYQQC